MKIGIIGIGIVGGAIKYGMCKLGHDVKVHDIKLGTSIQDVVDTEICYICLPTPSVEGGKCDTSIVESTIKELIETYHYENIIAIKSTVEPGFTLGLQKRYNTHKICFVPEFLRERCAIADFMENHDVCVVGTESEDVFEVVKSSHGKFPKKFAKVSTTEAEFVKYMNNVHNATLVILANSFYELCKVCKVDYSKVKNTLVLRNHIKDMYLDCNEFFRGFGGMCLPKDTIAMDNLAKKYNTNVEFFEFLLNENNKYRITVPEGMRNDKEINNER